MLRGLVGLVEAQAQQIETLRAAVELLEGRLTLRSQVDALLAHELRTPLTVIIGVLQTVRTTPMEEQQRNDFVSRALAQATHLAAAVDDMTSAPEGAGPLFTRARMRSVPMGQMIDQALDAVPAAVASNRVRVDIDRSLVLSTAPSRFVAIVVNLLQNATKYGGTGPIEISANQDEQRNVVVAVSDRGPGLRGVPPELLFEAFSRGKHKSDAPGHGIGLYVVGMLARSLGGTATISDREGGGAIANVVLPQRRMADPVQARSHPATA